MPTCLQIFKKPSHAAIHYDMLEKCSGIRVIKKYPNQIHRITDVKLKKLK